MKKSIDIALKEVVNFIKSTHHQVSPSWKTESKYHQYYILLAETTLSNDEIAKKLFYKNAKDPSFYRFQLRFEEKLLQFLLSISGNFNSANKLRDLIYSGLYYFHSAFIIRFYGLTDLSLYYFKKALKEFINSEINEFAYLSASEIFRIYSIVLSNQKKGKKYWKLLHKYKQNYEVELNLIYLESELLEILDRNLDYKSLSSKAESVYNEALKVFRKYNSRNINNKSFLLIVFYLDLVNDYDKQIEMTKEFEEKQSSPSYFDRYVIAKTYSLNLIRRGDLKQALEKIYSFKNKFDTDNKNLFTIMTYEYICHQRMGDYTMLERLLEEMSKLKVIQYNQRIKELYLIRVGYFELIKELGVHAEHNDLAAPLSNFRINKLLNEIEVLSKDKTGFNVSLRLLESFFYITRKQDNKFIDKIEATKQYAYKYLRKDDSLRLKIMLRLIIVCYERNFKVKSIKRHAAPLLDKLKANPLKITDSIDQPEVIPFDWLWEQLLNYIEFHYSQRV